MTATGIGETYWYRDSHDNLLLLVVSLISTAVLITLVATASATTIVLIIIIHGRQEGRKPINEFQSKPLTPKPLNP